MLKIYGNINIVFQIKEINKIALKLLVFQGKLESYKFSLYNFIREICQIAKQGSRFKEERREKIIRQKNPC